VAAHEFGGGFLVGSVELDGMHLLVVRHFIDAGSDFFGALEIAVGKCNGSNLRLPRHIEDSG
jgi:hypothetical protein